MIRRSVGDEELNQDWVHAVAELLWSLISRTVEAHPVLRDGPSRSYLIIAITTPVPFIGYTGSPNLAGGRR